MAIVHEVTKWGQEYDYEITSKIPQNYDVWNVGGINNYPDYLPLCVVYPGTYTVLTESLLAIRMPKEDQKILQDCAMKTGASNLAKCRRLLKRKNIKQRTRDLAMAALPLFEKYTSDERYATWQMSWEK